MQDTIRGQVNAAVLNKVDRLFRNDDAGVWIELLQNSRRAGATVVQISISDASNSNGECMITIEDNGRGIDNFQNLVTLGGSGWGSDTEEKEDPAGMGFFALCRSHVEVHSGETIVLITPEIFLGNDKAQLQTTDQFVAGTRLRFNRASTKKALSVALSRVAEFCPLEVCLEGQQLDRRDFLAGALHREMIDGIEVGFSNAFAFGLDYSSFHGDLNWNFYGARIHHGFNSIPGLLGFSGHGALSSLRARFNVLETACVKLQLPDRRGIIEDAFFSDFMRKTRAAAYKFFQGQPQHALPFKNWKEAKDLGVGLPEAAYLLTTWHAPPQDDSSEGHFGRPEQLLLSDIANAAIVDSCLPNPHTLEGALRSGAVLERTLYQERWEYVGYTWYDGLPKLADTKIIVDDVPWESWKNKARPETIRVEVRIEQSGGSGTVRLPALIHVQSEDTYEPSFIAVTNSPWDGDLDGPFSAIDFLMDATFCPRDDSDSDSRQTQEEDHLKIIEREVNTYFRSPQASLVACLRRAIDWSANELAMAIGVTEIRFKRSGLGSREWEIELVTDSKVPGPHPPAVSS